MDTNVERSLTKPWPISFCVQVHLQNISVKFICQGYGVKSR